MSDKLFDLAGGVAPASAADSCLDGETTTGDGGMRHGSLSTCDERGTDMSLVSRLQHYAATMKSDFEASLELLADDIVWINLLPDNVPFGGTYRGREEVVHYFAQMAETFVIGEYEWDRFEYIESGDTLVMVGYESGGKAVPTGRVFDLHFVWVVKFDEQGRICYLREHNDTAAIGDAFRA